MLNDDVGFLAIFIVLPTILIVSGFWLILFVRRDAQARSVARVNLTSESAPAEPLAERPVPKAGPVSLGADFETQQEEISPFGLPASAVPISELPPDWALPSELDALTSPPDLEGPSDRLSPVVADLLYSDAPPPLPTVSNVRLIELLEEEDRDSMREAIGIEPDVELSSEELLGSTGDIQPPEDYLEYLGVSLPPADVDPEIDEIVASLPHDEPEPQDSEASTDSRSGGDTAELPEPGEVDEEIREAENADMDARRQRQPEARLVPPRQHTRRRGRSAGRRVPKIPRSTSRDEDTVESDDRG